ncbi:MAG: hypothetical protein PHZ09_12080 [Eubacteriales bacterium]|nr:hypothetical protein [Eubacteriales bacterium]
MKKTRVILTLVLTLAIILPGLRAFAADSAVVYVTISTGELAFAREAVTVTDTDGDGVLTISDALRAAHEAGYDGGAAGYAVEDTEWGASLTRLWGVETGGSCGYYVNNLSAMSLADAVADGDSVSAFVYTDTTGFSDVYCYFDTGSVAAAPGEPFTLTLSAAAFDENWNPVVKPVAGAVILIDGSETSFVTDAEGKVTLSVPGSSIVSAGSDSAILVPPACIVDTDIVTAPQTGDCTLTLSVIAAGLALAGIASRRRYMRVR